MPNWRESRAPLSLPLAVVLLVSGSLLLEVGLTVVVMKSTSLKADSESTATTVVSQLHDLFKFVGSDLVTELQTQVRVLEGVQGFVWDTVKVRFFSSAFL